jgi:hypothetical protein
MVIVMGHRFFAISHLTDQILVCSSVDTCRLFFLQADYCKRAVSPAAEVQNQEHIHSSQSFFIAMLFSAVKMSPMVVSRCCFLQPTHDLMHT